jgi:hypothetical protein
MEKVQDREKLGRVTDDYRTELLADLRDPSYAAGYLKAVLSDGDRDAIIMALKDIADAYHIEGSDTIDANYLQSLTSGLREHLTKLDEMTQKLENIQTPPHQPGAVQNW